MDKGISMWVGTTEIKKVVPLVGICTAKAITHQPNRRFSTVSPCASRYLGR
jgi:hypothetical protein